MSTPSYDTHANPFYSVSHENKIKALQTIVGMTIVNIKSILDDISDGCGGCERMSYSNPVGGMDWVTVLTDLGERIAYAGIREDGNLITHVSVIEVARWVLGSYHTQDHHAMYGALMQDFQKLDVAQGGFGS